MREGARRGRSCPCFPWLPPLPSKDPLMASVRDARPFLTPLTAIITGLEAGTAAAVEKSCPNTIKLPATPRERAEELPDGGNVVLPGELAQK